MKAAVLTAERTVEVREVDDPAPRPDEIVIAVAASGICGSDLHAWHGRHPFRQPPVVLGHEPAGTVVARGAEVTTVEVGEQVVIQPHRICGTCDACRAGDNEICEHKQYPATHDWTGSLAEFFTAPATMAHRVPHGLPIELAALAEPLAVACHANRRGGTGPGTVVNIVGSGTVGLLCLMVARHLGAEVDVVTDIDPQKLSFATSLGAKRASDVRTSTIVEELRGRRYHRADVTIIAATAPQSLVDGSALTKPGGRIVLLGLYRDTAEVAASMLVTDEQAIIGSLCYNSADFDLALQLLAADPDTYGKFITKRVGLHEVGDEFRRQADGGDAIKTLVIPGLIR